MNIILASGSPRRRELLHQIGLDFTVSVPDVDESAFSGLSAISLVKTLSREKAKEVAQRADADAVVIAADTVVVRDGAILGKPSGEAEAVAMLQSLSGRSHTVCTGVTVCRNKTVLTDAVETEVTFRPLTEAEIAAYVRTGEPMDKAGAYGIQGLGALLVEGIRGDYSNVVGLPLCRLGEMLRQVGL